MDIANFSQEITIQHIYVDENQEIPFSRNIISNIPVSLYKLSLRETKFSLSWHSIANKDDFVMQYQ